MRPYHWILTACLLIAWIAIPAGSSSDAEHATSENVTSVSPDSSAEPAGTCKGRVGCKGKEQSKGCSRGEQENEAGCSGACKGAGKTHGKQAVVIPTGDGAADTAATPAVTDQHDESVEQLTGPPAFTQAIHALLSDHEKITREVTDIPDGIESVTTSEDPEVAAVIQKHVHEMAVRLEKGQPVRMWDPLFREIFAHYDKIKMEVIEVDGGVKVRETSDDPMVVMLIRQHAHQGVSEFVRDGSDRAHKSTPMPEGYVASETNDEPVDHGMGHGRGGGMGRGQGRGMGRGQGHGPGMGEGHGQGEDTPATPQP